MSMIITLYGFCLLLFCYVFSLLQLKIYCSGSQGAKFWETLHLKSKVLIRNMFLRRKINTHLQKETAIIMLGSTFVALPST